MFNQIKKLSLVGTLAAALLSVSACDDADSGNFMSPPSANNQTVVESRLSEFTEGSLNSIKESKQALQTKWRTSNGAEISVELAPKNYALLDAKDLHGPFNYDFTAGMGLLNLAQARDIAASAASGEFSGWKLNKNGTDGRWTYSIKIDDFNRLEENDSDDSDDDMDDDADDHSDDDIDDDADDHSDDDMDDDADDHSDDDMDDDADDHSDDDLDDDADDHSDDGLDDDADDHSDDDLDDDADDHSDDDLDDDKDDKTSNGTTTITIDALLGHILSVD